MGGKGKEDMLWHQAISEVPLPFIPDLSFCFGCGTSISQPGENALKTISLSAS